MLDVKVYSTPGCMYCGMLKDFLNEKNIEFTEYNVAEDEEKRQYIIEKSGQMGVPVTEINGEIVVGFNEAKIEEMVSQSSD